MIAVYYPGCSNYTLAQTTLGLDLGTGWTRARITMPLNGSLLESTHKPLAHKMNVQTSIIPQNTPYISS